MICINIIHTTICINIIHTTICINLRLYNTTKSFSHTRYMSIPKATENKVKDTDVDFDESDRLLEKYDKLLQMLDYRNMLYYGALFRQMYSDFSTEEDDGTINKSIDDLAKLLEKACQKLNFDIHNANVKQLGKLFSALIQKLKGSTKLRAYDPDVLEPLVSRMYNDDEVMDLLMYLDEKGVNPENIVAVNENDEIVFSNKKKYKLNESTKLHELVDYLADNRAK
jgi:hypothetical protein